MNQEELENLPYPMFNTTKEEKDCLYGIMTRISPKDRDYFLCILLEHTTRLTPVIEALKDKIKQSVGEHYTLSDLLGLGDIECDELQAELRRIWIRKLLEYKGE